MQVCYRLHAFLLKYAVRFMKRLAQLHPQERHLLVNTIREVSCVTHLLPSDFRASNSKTKLSLLFFDVRVAFESPPDSGGDPSISYSSTDLGVH